MTQAELQGGLIAHASGALWVPQTRTAILADLHLGYAWAQRRRGMLGPLVEGGALSRIDAMLRALEPARVILNGDIVHAPRPAPAEREWIEAALGLLAAKRELVCVAGNHDRGLLRDFAHLNLHIASEWREGPLHALHGDRLPRLLPETTAIIGHFHPILRLKDSAGVSMPLRAFLHGQGFCVQPAFSPFAAGADVRFQLAPQLEQWLSGAKVFAVVTNGERVHAIRRAVTIGLRKQTPEPPPWHRQRPDPEDCPEP